uniref:Uncharacterized protein n=1 Tax=Anguilla anguilla TaxID=7936 RepID=A0A0E9RBT6_ANGAN
MTVKLEVGLRIPPRKSFPSLRKCFSMFVGFDHTTWFFLH